MIIGINGFKRAGKDTAANYICSMPIQPRFRKMAFADPVKDAFCALTGLDRATLEILKNDPTAYLAVGYINNPTEAPEGVDTSFAEADDGSVRMWSPITDPVTVRNGLKRTGTEVGRDIIGEEVWINLLDERIADLGYENIVISDLRFANEAQWINDCGGKVIRINRTEVEEGDSHRSEMWLDNDLIDFEVDNNNNKEHLYYQLEHIMTTILKGVNNGS